LGEQQQSAASTLAMAALQVLTNADPLAKASLSRRFATAWRNGTLKDLGSVASPDRPGRPPRPELRPPRDMPRRKLGKDPAGRIALLHALAHIELNAIDLAWDIIARFPAEAMPRAFFDDWVSVADEEAKHFALLAARLAELGASYGDLPAHDGLWQAAMDTADDLLARLAVVPLVLEARGLDVTPAMIKRLEAVGDQASAALLQVIYRDEIGHVAIGKRWFDFLAERRGLEPKAAWQDLVRQRFKGRMKGPFNDEARAAAGFPATFYRPLAAGDGTG
jgi:uncharacterized ferritin-like protein (DUF455 family)